MIKLIKAPNANVRLVDNNDKVKMSFATAQNVFRHQTIEDAVFITSSSSAQEEDDGYILSINDIDKENSSPAITAENIDDLIIELADNFFFEAH